MMRYTTPNAKIVALLHDVVRRHLCDLRNSFKRRVFSPEVLDTLRLVTHSPNVPYDAYIDTIMTNPTATEVKIADLEDNIDIRRLQEVDDRSVARLRKYLLAYRRLTAKPDEQTA